MTDPRRATGEFKVPATAGEAEAARTERGQLTTGVLGELLGRIAACRSVCYLLVTDGRSERCAFFPVGGVRLSSTGRRRAVSLLEVVRIDQDVAPNEGALRWLDALEQSGGNLEEALTSPKQRRASGLDDAAAEALSRAVDRWSRVIVRDELIDLVAWDGAEYEFRESNPPTEIFDARLEAVKLSLGVKDVLAEVTQKIDEWRGLAARVGVGPNARMVRDLRHEAKDGLEQALLDAAGEKGCSIDDAIIAARRAGADAIMALGGIEALKSRGAIRTQQLAQRLSPEEERARRRAEAEEIEGRLPLIMHQIAARRRLADDYGVLGEPELAVEHLRWIGDELVRRDEPEQAMDAYRRILEVAPNAFYAREQICELFERMGKKADAIREWLELAKLYAKNNLLNRALQKLKRAIRLEPKNPDHRRRLIDVLLAMELKDAAAREYEDLAKLYEADGKVPEALQCYQQVYKLQPTNEAALARLQAVARKQLSNVVPLAVMALGGVGLVFLALFVHARYDAMSAFGAARAAAIEHANGRRFPAAYEALEGFSKDYPSYQPERVTRVREQIADRELFEAKGRYGAAKKLEAEGKLGEALRIYLDVAATYQATEWGVNAKRQAAAIQDLEKEAGELADKVRNLHRTGQPEAAFSRGRDLLRQYGWSQAAAELSIPFLVRSNPPGARVYADGKDMEGVTPLVAAGVGTKPVRITLELDGCEPADLEVDLRAPAQGYAVDAELSRRTRWRAPTRGPVAFGAAVDPYGVYVASSDETVYGLDSQGGTRWSRRLGFCAEAAGPPVKLGELLVVADAEGKVLGLSAATGDVRWTWQGRAGLQTVGVVEDRAVLLASTDLVVVLEANGAARWQQAPPAPLAAPPVVAPNVGIMATTTDGHLNFFDVASGKVGRMRITGRPSAAPAVGWSGYLVATEDGVLRLIGRTPLWECNLGAATKVTPVQAGEHVFATAGSKLLALNARTGKRVWEQTLTAPISAPPVFKDGRLYVALQDGRVHAFTAATGATRWVYRTGGEVLAAPVVAPDGTVYVTSTDMHVHAVVE